MSGFTLDTGGLIAIERHDRGLLALLERARTRRQRIIVPSTVLAQATRNPARQVGLRRFISGEGVHVAPLDEGEATAIGMLLARTRTSDIVDAHVALCARRAGHAVVTSDPNDIRRIDPDLMLVEV